MESSVAKQTKLEFQASHASSSRPLPNELYSVPPQISGWTQPDKIILARDPKHSARRGIRPWGYAPVGDHQKPYKPLFWLSDLNSTETIYQRRVSARISFLIFCCYFAYFLFKMLKQFRRPLSIIEVATTGFWFPSRSRWSWNVGCKRCLKRLELMLDFWIQTRVLKGSWC